ncbi:MAG: DNA translocase FtsK [Arsenophonus sp.]|nr:MAG: DNA translocase FtsK [Arsenophonus sp.]
MNNLQLKLSLFFLFVLGCLMPVSFLLIKFTKKIVISFLSFIFFLLKKIFSISLKEEKIKHLKICRKKKKKEKNIFYQQSKQLECELMNFNISAKVIEFCHGPVITRFYLKLAPGVRIKQISNLSQDLACSLSTQKIKIIESIHEKPYIGIDILNKNREIINLISIINCNKFKKNQTKIPILLGKDVEGKLLIKNLETMPHLLVAGSTGSGKSMWINSMIISILYKKKPKDIQFIIIDPKILEFSIYQGIPHLINNIITNIQDSIEILKWCIQEMERRFNIMNFLQVKNLKNFNNKIKKIKNKKKLNKLILKTNNFKKTLKKEPYIIIIIDEFADLIMQNKEIVPLIIKLVQKSRASGIHIILSTQRPSANIINGLIKANIPSRIAFTVSSKIESRIILDQDGAESLTGKGDMLYLPQNSSIPIRAHSPFIKEEEIKKIVNFFKKN